MSIETSKLPEKPSELIMLALKDLKAAEESKKYEIRMEDWHNPNDLKFLEASEIPEEEIHKCEVCFAGSVMAFSLEGDINRHYEPKDFPGEKRKLRALDVFRKGQVSYGMTIFYGDRDTTNYEEIQDYFLIPYYHDDREGFHEAMAEMADHLKEKGY